MESRTFNIVVGSVIGLSVLCVGLLTYLILRSLRVRNYRPKLIPTEFLKQKWKSWSPSSSYGRVPSNSAAAHEQAGTSLDQSQMTAYNGGVDVESAAAADMTIDRNTSIRSVMTLPAYSPNPKPSEKVIGREGERAGMDVVVEFPETMDEEETRREEEMESLYQIRLVRRREIAERDERRRLRREARERGDFETLRRLRAESRARREREDDATGTDAVSAAALLADHQARGRDRRISSVSYAEVGHVRHDGSRVRASSQGSESHLALLDAAATMGHDSNEPSRAHYRSLSGTSLLSQTSLSDMDRAITPETDIADSTIPHPPPYEHVELGEVPPYPHPSQEPSQPGRPARLSNVPSIAVENATPPSSAPSSPILPTERAHPPTDRPSIPASMRQ